MVDFLFQGTSGSLFNLDTSKNSRGWDRIPEKYKSSKNKEMYCYMNFLGFDAEMMFLKEVSRIEGNQY